MKVLLVYPYFIEERIHVEDISAPPIGIYQIAAVLKEQGLEVEILNCADLREKPERIREILEEKAPDLVGFSILHANRWGGIEIARIAKELNPSVKTVFGGIGATFLWNHLLTHFPEIDYVIPGEGERPVLELLRHLEGKGASDPEMIRGLAFRKNGRILRTEDPDPIADLDELPIPAEYFQYRHLASSRGCAWKCTFCGSPAFWGGRIRFRSPEHFVREIELLYGKGINLFYISDDTFTFDRKRVIRICKAILEKGMEINWYAISRVDRVDEEILYWMRKAGCIQISYGVESGSEKIRRTLNKKISTDRIEKAFSLTTRYGIMSRAYIIYGSPGETWQTVQESIDLIHRIKPLSVIFYILDIFPGTELYRRLQHGSGVRDDVWLNKIEGIMYFETDPLLTEELILAFGKRLRTSFYENVHAYADAVELVDQKDLHQKHADFCSRLGMTFSHGDYAGNEMVREKKETAEKLFRKALQYAPDHRAYLGLGILKQQERNFEQSIRILRQGLKWFPQSEQLHLCLGIDLMNLGRFEEAETHFRKFPGSAQAKHYLDLCRANPRT